ncbi:NYN domain-containing protein [Moraxella porci]|uniref:NYN domain-containing protein n=1 Tax=Moraxella porci TaxID=1288392 RepID=UPI0024486C18|nr:NYN domain-containing protein [Moraxella porci]MDH2273409.1 NYN domain-containing protein [Moraxella porci]
MNDEKVALLIDINQCSHHKLPEIIVQASQFGELTQIRAYGNWTAETMMAWHRWTDTFSIELIDNSIYIDKNTTTHTLSIDAVSLFYEHGINVFYLCISSMLYAPLLEFLKMQRVQVQLMHSQNISEEFVNLVAKLSGNNDSVQIAELAPCADDSTCVIDDTILSQVVDDCIDVLGWARLKKIHRQIAPSHPSLKSKTLLTLLQMAGFDICKTKELIWIKSKNNNHLRNAILDDFDAQLHILQCVWALQSDGQFVSLTNLATLLHHNAQVLPENYGYDNYLDLLINLPYFQRKVGNSAVQIQYTKSDKFHEKVVNFILDGGLIPPLAVRSLDELEFISGLRVLNNRYIEFLKLYVKEFIVPDKGLAAYVILYPILNNHPDIDSYDFGYKKWLDVFRQSSEFVVVEQDNQFWVGCK